MNNICTLSNFYFFLFLDTVQAPVIQNPASCTESPPLVQKSPSFSGSPGSQKIFEGPTREKRPNIKGPQS